MPFDLIGSLYTFMGAGADPLSCMCHAALFSCVLIYTYAFLYWVVPVLWLDWDDDSL